MSEVIKNRYDFVILFDVQNGNPNGDPDLDNSPRVDPETGHGIITDGCLKRKIRDYVDAVYEDKSYKPGEAQNNIYVKRGIFLNDQQKKAYDSLGIPVSKTLPKDVEKAKALTQFMCHNFYDIRAFGAVMTTGVNCGQVRGPVQLGFSRSIDEVLPLDIALTRVTPTKFEKTKENKNTEFGNKYIIPYGLYRCEGYVSANLARKTTGFSEEDLELLWTAILNMFELDHSAARGNMAVRELIVFKHDSELGCAPAWKLFDAVQVKRKENVAVARSFGDYTVTIQEDAIPQGVTVKRMG